MPCYHKNYIVFNACGFHISSKLEKKKKPATLQNLIDNIEKGTSEKSLDDIFKKVRDQNQKEVKRKEYLQNKLEAAQKQRKIMEKYDERSDQKGKSFWFKKRKTTDVVMSEAEEINLTEQLETSIEPKFDDGIQFEQRNHVEIKELKKRLDDDSSDREVSKLMTAMIDSIDDGAEDVEENLQKLIQAFNVNEVKKTMRNEMREKGSRTTQRRVPSSSFGKGKSSMKTSFDKPTNLFGSVSQEKVDIKASADLFQIKWKEELHALLPEYKPKNAFEVRMLDIGREWDYPIDNEQNMGIEESTSFDEHVFLDHLLDEFPEEGPVYKFMELVITGLQQNPYLTVPEKNKSNNVV